MRSIKVIDLCDSQDTFLKWRPDIQLIKDHLPGVLFGDLVDIEEQVDRESGGNLNKFAENYEVIRVVLDDESEAVIHFRDIVEWYSDYVDSFSLFADGAKLFLIISPASGQAGAIGIWDANSLKWSFNYSDEFFCVESLSVISEIYTVIGNTSFHLPMQDFSGRDLFIIREGQIFIFKTLQLENAPDLKSKYLYRLKGNNETIVYEYFNDWLIVLLVGNLKSYYLVPKETKLLER